MENSYSKANIALTQNQIEFISCLFNDTEGVLSYPMLELVTPRFPRLSKLHTLLQPIPWI